MKKEKTVKTYQRRTKSGKVVTVRQHTAKYDAADKASGASKKKGSGDELESLKKSKTMDTPVEISKDDFKEWYNFNEWDTPKKEWPESVKKVDSHLRKTMGKKGYDDYCAKIDESWSARGHLKAYKDFSASSNVSPVKDVKTKVSNKADSKQPKGDTPYTSNGSYYNSKLSPEEFMGKFFKLHSSGKYTEAAKMLDSTLGKGAWDTLNKKAPSFDFDSTKDRNEKFMGLVEEQVGEHHWNSQQGKSKKDTSTKSKSSNIDVATEDEKTQSKHLGSLNKKVSTLEKKLKDLRGIHSGLKRGDPRKMSYAEKIQKVQKDLLETKKAADNQSKLVGDTSTKPKSMKEELSSLLNGLNGSTLRTFKKPAKFTSRKDGTLEASVYDSDIRDNLKKSGWKNIDSVGIVGGTSNYVSPDGKYHAIVGHNRTRIKVIRNGEKVNGHSLDSIFNRGNKEEGNKYD